jgi:hypothetical protein
MVACIGRENVTDHERFTEDAISKFMLSLRNGTILEYFERVAKNKINLRKEVTRRAKAEARVLEIKSAKSDLKQRFDNFLEAMEPGKNESPTAD